jgi:hypothetical protein
MSDDTPTPIPPPSSQKTSAVPLKKETVRITLRARPAAGVTQPREATSPVLPVSAAPKKATAPIQLPSAPLPPPAPKSSTSPVSLPAAPMPPPSAQAAPPVPTSVGLPAPTAPRPTAPPAPRPPGAPAIPGAAPRVETGLATAPLAGGADLPVATVRMKLPTQGVAAPRPAPRAVGAGGTGALPKATVKLQQGPGVGRPGMPAPSAAPVKRMSQQDSEDFYDEKDPEAGLVPLSVMCLILGVVLLVVQMMATDTVMSAPANQPSALMVPENTRVDWETQDATGGWKSSFERVLPQIPQ